MLNFRAAAGPSACLVTAAAGLPFGSTSGSKREERQGCGKAALLVFSGTQLVMLGIIGEYVGRMFLTVNQRPQAIVREVVTKAATSAT